MSRKTKNSTVPSPSANPLAICNALRIPPATYFGAMAKFAQTIQTATAEFDRLAGSDSQRQSALRAHVASQIGTLLNGGEAVAEPKPAKSRATRKAKPAKPAKPVKRGRKARAAKSEESTGGTAGRKPNGPDGKGVKQIVTEILQDSSVPMTTDAIEGMVRERYSNAGIKVPKSIGGQIGTALSALKNGEQVTAESAGEGRRKVYAWCGETVAA
jgi:hypothetical protein